MTYIKSMCNFMMMIIIIIIIIIILVMRWKPGTRKVNSIISNNENLRIQIRKPFRNIWRTSAYLNQGVIFVQFLGLLVWQEKIRSACSNEKIYVAIMMGWFLWIPKIHLFLYFINSTNIRHILGRNQWQTSSFPWKMAPSLCRTDRPCRLIQLIYFFSWSFTFTFMKMTKFIQVICETYRAYHC